MKKGETEMAKKIFRVHLDSGYSGIYDDFLVKAEDASDIEYGFDLDDWASAYEYVTGAYDEEDEEEQEAILEDYYASLSIKVDEVSVEELLEEGYTLERIEKIEEF